MRSLSETIADLRKVGISFVSPPTEMPPAQTRFEAPIHVGKSVRWDLPLEVGAFSMIHGPGQITAAKIGRYCSVAPNATIGSNEHAINWLSTCSLVEDPHIFQWPERIGYAERDRLNGRPFPESIAVTEIGHDVWIGYGAFLRGGVKIGHGAIIGAMSVVLNDVPPYAIVVGNPARLIRFRFDHQLIADIMRVQWWRFSIYDLMRFDLTSTGAALAEITKAEERGDLIPMDQEWTGLC